MRSWTNRVGFHLFWMVNGFLASLLIAGASSGQGISFDFPLLQPRSGAEYGTFSSTSQYEQETLNRINYHRAIAGLDAFTVSSALNGAAQAHADYLNLNNVFSHEEEAGKPGYLGQWAWDRATAAGYNWSAIGEVMSGGLGAEEGVDALIMAIYHRFVLLGSGYTEVGIGDASHPTYGKVQVIDTARPMGTPSNKGVIAIYPADGQVKVPLDFDSDTEWPDPVPGKNTVGYPVSIQFSSDYTVSLDSFEVSLNGTALGATILAKGQDPHISGNSYAVIPSDPLSSNTIYDVVFKGAVNGQTYQKNWSFSTGTTFPLKVDFSGASAQFGKEVMHVENIKVIGNGVSAVYWADFNFNIDTLALDLGAVQSGTGSFNPPQTGGDVVSFSSASAVFTTDQATITPVEVKSGASYLSFWAIYQFQLDKAAFVLVNARASRRG